MRRYEAHYFRDAYLCRYMGLKADGPELDGSFDHLGKMASRAESEFLLHRDFQSRNIMVCKGTIGILDWQGARLGPLGYDLASLLIDPYTRLPQSDQQKVFQHYRRRIGVYNPQWADSFNRTFPYLAIQRNLQILGAFAFLTKGMNKPYFETYIPTALSTLHNLLLQVRDPGLSPLTDLTGRLLT